MCPPELMFGMTYHALMVPPFPGSMLVLGWGEGTVPYLARKIWGQDFQISGVDIRPPQQLYTEMLLNEGNTTHLIADAEAFVQNADKYDIVILDLYNGSKIPDFVFKKEFIKALAAITGKQLIVNCTHYDWKDFDGFDDYFLLDVVKQVQRDKVAMFIPRRLFRDMAAAVKNKLKVLQ